MLSRTFITGQISVDSMLTYFAVLYTTSLTNSQAQLQCSNSNYNQMMLLYEHFAKYCIAGNIC